MRCPLPELLGRRKRVDGSFHAGRVVDLDDSHSVRRIGEFQAKEFRRSHALAGCPRRTCLYRAFASTTAMGKWERLPQDVIGALLSSASCLASDEYNPSVGEGPLFVDRVRCIVPARFLEASGTTNLRHVSASVLVIGVNMRGHVTIPRSGSSPAEPASASRPRHRAALGSGPRPSLTAAKNSRSASSMSSTETPAPRAQVRAGELT